VAQLKTADRSRCKLSVTVHPATKDALAALSERFRMPAGRMIDRMTEILNAAYTAGKMSCVTGGVCPMNRTDLPAVL